MLDYCCVLHCAKEHEHISPSSGMRLGLVVSIGASTPILFRSRGNRHDLSLSRISRRRKAALSKRFVYKNRREENRSPLLLHCDMKLVLLGYLLLMLPIYKEWMLSRYRYSCLSVLSRRARKAGSRPFHCWHWANKLLFLFFSIISPAIFPTHWLPLPISWSRVSALSSAILTPDCMFVQTAFPAGKSAASISSSSSKKDYSILWTDWSYIDFFVSSCEFPFHACCFRSCWRRYCFYACKQANSFAPRVFKAIETGLICEDLVN